MGVSDDVAQELQMPTGSQALEGVEEMMPSRPATPKIQAAPDQIVLDHRHSLTHLPSQPWCKVCVQSRGRDSPHREKSKMDAVVPQLHFDYGCRSSTDCMFPAGNRHFFWSHTCDNCARHQQDGHALRGWWNSQVGA